MARGIVTCLQGAGPVVGLTAPMVSWPGTPAMAVCGEAGRLRRMAKLRPDVTREVSEQLSALVAGELAQLDRADDARDDAGDNHAQFPTNISV